MASNYSGIDLASVYSAIERASSGLVAPMKRSSEVPYNETVLETHNAVEQEDFYSTNSLNKRLRLETARILPIYPQRPGEKDCAYYMMTRTCKFGDACIFDHPIWVPEGGLPDWKEGPIIHSSESLPERPGEPDCMYYMKTQRCKFGIRCKFNHPKDVANSASAEVSDDFALPQRPSEPICSFYAKTGNCKFGKSCKFHHPSDVIFSSVGQVLGIADNIAYKATESVIPFTPAIMHNSKGLPIRPGETDCPFYLKTGSCKYSSACRFNHPDRYFVNPAVALAIGHGTLQSASTNIPVEFLNPSAANFFQHVALPSVYPQRPGQLECDFYMKTGQCRFGERCRFHHPVDRTSSSAVGNQIQQDIQLTFAGLPRREGMLACPYYMKMGACKFGVACKFDHPPPGEAAAAMAVSVLDA